MNYDQLAANAQSAMVGVLIAFILIGITAGLLAMIFYKEKDK